MRHKNPKTLSGIETASASLLAKFLFSGTKTLKPYQGLKLCKAFHVGFLLLLNGTKTLKPYQGLKQGFLIICKFPILGHKNPKTLSGIETLSNSGSTFHSKVRHKNPKTLSGIETVAKSLPPQPGRLAEFLQGPKQGFVISAES